MMITKIFKYAKWFVYWGTVAFFEVINIFCIYGEGSTTYLIFTDFDEWVRGNGKLDFPLDCPVFIVFMLLLFSLCFYYGNKWLYHKQKKGLLILMLPSFVFAGILLITFLYFYTYNELGWR